MKLDTEFGKLPLRFDPERLALEASAFAESEWRPHPQGHAGNTAIALIAVNGDPADDAVKGPMRPTAFLDRCPYMRQVLASFGSVLGRTRLMRIAGQGEATEHVDTNYYWIQRVRIHVPIITHPPVRFYCGGKNVHMAAGETWIFDTYRLHNVLNNCDDARIHLVSDTVGSPAFWDLVAQAERPFDPDPQAMMSPQLIAFQPGHHPALETEGSNFPIVMTPWEQECLIAGLLEDMSESKDAQSTQLTKIEAILERFQRQWRSLWARHGTDRSGWDAYRQSITQLESNIKPFTDQIHLPNGMDCVEMISQLIVRAAVNPEVAPPAPGAEVIKSAAKEAPEAGMIAPKAPATPIAQPAGSPSRIERPVIIVAAPRSGSTLLFETLSRSPSAWTLGGESHEVIEQIGKLDPARRGFDSNRLTEADVDADIAATLRARFLNRLKNRDGKPIHPNAGPVRLLEKTPKNALRIPFMNAVFPQALFIYLYREPRDNLSSMIDAWRSGRFVTYPQLPGWDGAPWSLLLVPGWRELQGRPLADVTAAQWRIANDVMLDDLSTLPAQRWIGITYADLLADPQGQAKRLCDFAGLAWDQTLPDRLPLSRYTLTPPDPNKWQRNAQELQAALPQVEKSAARARQAVAAWMGPAGHAAESTVPANGEPMLASASTTTATNPTKPETTVTQAPPAPSAQQQPQGNRPPSLRSVFTTNLPQLFEQLGISLLVSTYQAGKLIAVRVQDGKLNTHFRAFAQPMGMALKNGRLALGTHMHVWELRNQPDVGRKLEPIGRHDACFMPRSGHVTGDIRIHELAFAGDELWIVNTRFSCLCTLDNVHSFVPRWRPSFITKLAAEDRCHLNGLAVIDDKPKLVTMLGESDKMGGWRENKAYGGMLMDIESGETVAAGLSMPHSPRWYDGKIWLLESGTGTISVVDEKTGRPETVTELPGFTRGLDFYGQFAFIGLSQVRESAVFSGIPITKKPQERMCGVYVVDLKAGKPVGFLRFEEGVQEIFAIQVLAGVRFPEILTEDEKLIANSFVLPDEVLSEVAREPALV